MADLAGTGADDTLDGTEIDSGFSWDEIAVRVLANFEATGTWYF